jgi:hypothetical protein
MPLPRHTGLDPVSPPVRAKIVSEANKKKAKENEKQYI